MGFLQLLAVLWARRVVVVGCFVSTVVLAVLVTLILPKSYEAKVTVLVDHDQRNAYTNDFDNRIALSEFLGKQVAILTSNRTAHQVVSTLNLTQNAEFRRAFFSVKRPKTTIEDWIAHSLLKALNVTPEPTQSSLVIDFRAETADAAATIANAFADAYMRTNQDIRVNSAQQTAQSLKEQARQLQKQLADAESSLRKFQQQTGTVVTGPDQLDTEQKQLDALSELRVKTNSDLEDARAQLSAFRQAKASGVSDDDLDAVVNNTLIESLRGQLADLNANLAQIRARYGVSHPDYTSGLAKKRALESEIHSEVRRIGASLQARVVSDKQKLSDLDKAISKQKNKVLDLQQHWDEYSVYLNQVKTKRTELQKAIARSGEEAIESRVAATSAIVLSPADPPTSADFPNLLLNTALAIIFGGFFGMVMAVLVELFDRRIRSADDFEDAAGAPVLVVMPKRA